MQAFGEILGQGALASKEFRMKKPNPKIRWHLTTEEKNKIRELSLKGWRATAIAAEMRLTRTTVMRVRKAWDLPGKPVLPEKQILALLERGVEQRRIARTLKVSYRRVCSLARAHGYGQPRRGLSEIQFLSLVGDIFRREASAASLAKKHGTPYKWALAMAHCFLGIERFLPSWRNPLSGDFYLSPSKAVRPVITDQQRETNFVRLVQTIVRQRPTLASVDRNVLIYGILEKFMPADAEPALRTLWEQQLAIAVDSAAIARSSGFAH
jgi:hypothetical protein